MDEEKDLKVAAARKKLKKYQRKKIEIKNLTSSNCSREESPDFQHKQKSRLSSSSSRASSATDVSKCNNLQDPTTKANVQGESIDSESLSLNTVINASEHRCLTNATPQEIPINLSDLDTKNKEMTLLLSKEKEISSQYCMQNEELIQRLKLQDSQIESLQNIALSNGNAELAGLKEQLQVHKQTIGILVAEKANLQGSLSQLQQSQDLQIGEVNDLRGQLQASKQRVQSLEAAYQHLQTQTSSLSNSKDFDAQQLHNLQTENSKSSKIVDEMNATIAELRERIAGKSDENEKLTSEAEELKRNLELAQVHIQQLRNLSENGIGQQVTELRSALEETQNKLFESDASTQQARGERAQIEAQYQAYTSRLTSEIEQLKERLNGEIQKNGELLVTKAALEHQAEEGRSLQEKISELQKEKENLSNIVNSAHRDRDDAEKKCITLIRDNGQLSQLVSEQASKLDCLEAKVDRNSTQHVNTDQLLESMQSDKVAAARALSQNKQLKEQLEELQNGFVMMSNKKLELTEKLEQELHTKKGLNEKIAALSDTVDRQKNEMSRLKNTSICNGTITASEAVENLSLAHIEETKEVKIIKENDITLNGVDENNRDIVNHRSECNGVKEEPPRSSISEDGLQKAYDALEKRFTRCMSDLATISDEKQNLEHLVQQLQLETDTVGDYITIYQFQRGVMKQQMIDLKHECDLLKTEKKETLSKLNTLQRLFNTLALEASAIDAQNLSNAYATIIDKELNFMEPSAPPSPEKAKEEPPPVAKLEDEKVEMEATSAPPPQMRSAEELKAATESITVRRIIDLIGEMETSSELDLTALSNAHPCPQCSGKLITI